MKIWYLAPRDDLYQGLVPPEGYPWSPPYSKVFGVVVAAADEAAARQIAQQNSGAESTVYKEALPVGTITPWLDPSLTTCEDLAQRCEPGLILSDYLEG